MARSKVRVTHAFTPWRCWAAAAATARCKAGVARTSSFPEYGFSASLPRSRHRAMGPVENGLGSIQFNANA